MLFHLTRTSANAKTGPIPVSTSSAELCPVTCPFRGNGCYASSGPLAIHWAAVTDGRRGVSWPAFLELVRNLPAGQLWRHNQAGDLRDPGTVTGAADLAALTEASRGRRGFTYTHHRLTARAVTAIKAATSAGFTVNASTETLKAADSAVSRGLRAVTVVSATENRRFWRSPDGNPVVVCPAQVRDGMTCERCQLCHGRPQDVIIAFRAHGTGARKVEAAIAAAG